MTRAVPTPKLLLTAGAVAVATVAYAVGTHSDGTAGAATKARFATIGATGATGASGPTGRWGHGPGGRPGRRAFGQVLAEAAKALGVSEDKLTAALKELRPAAGTKPAAGEDLAKALASSTGVDLDKVKAALATQRPAFPGGMGHGGPGRHGGMGPGGPPAGATGRGGPPPGATGPGGPPSGTTGNGGPRPGFGHGGPPPAGATGPGGPPRGVGGPRGPRRGLDTAALAKALGVDEAKVTAGLDAFRADEKQAFQTLRATLVKQLADELGVPEAKVETVAERFLPRGFGGHGRP